MKAGWSFLRRGAVLLAGCAGGIALLQAGGSGQGMRDGSIWDGVYTQQQAVRGEAGAWAHCLACHAPTDWSEPRFLEEWGSRRLGDLYSAIRRSMPEDDPGRLSGDEYADILAYMLSLSNAPAGAVELPSDLEVLDRILIVPASAP